MLQRLVPLARMPKATSKTSRSGDSSCPLSDTHDKFEEFLFPLMHRLMRTETLDLEVTPN
jgi:hypothetical protein